MLNFLLKIFGEKKWTFLTVIALIDIITFSFNKSQAPLKESTLILKLDQKYSKDNIENEILLLKGNEAIRKIIEKIEVLPSDQKRKKALADKLTIRYQANFRVQECDDKSCLVIKTYDKDSQKSILIANAIADTYIFEKNNKANNKNKALFASLNKKKKNLFNQIVNIKSSIDAIPDDNKIFAVNEIGFEKLNKYLEDPKQAPYLKANELKESILKLEKIFIKDDDNNIYAFYSKKSYPEVTTVELLKDVLIKLEFEKYILNLEQGVKSPAANAVNKDIVKIKTGILKIIKRNYLKTITDKDETDIALLIKKIILEYELKAINLNIARAYKKETTLNPTQLQYNNLIEEAKDVTGIYLKTDGEAENIELNGSYPQNQNYILKQAELSSINSKNNIKIDYSLASLLGVFITIFYYVNKEKKFNSKITIKPAKSQH